MIESKPVGVTQLSMTAEVSPNGVITEVKVKNKFTTAKTEFQHLSSERAAESTDTETETDERKADTEDEDNSETSDLNENLSENQVDEVVNMNGNGEVSDDSPVTENGDLCSSLETDRAVDNHFNTSSTSETDAAGDGVHETGENNNDITSNTVEHHNGQPDSDTDVSKHTDVVNNTDDHSDDDGAVAATNKKPKLESLNDCDKEDFDPIGKNHILCLLLIHLVYLISILGDRNVLHSIMSQIDVYNRPFPSPDHTYAISPVKEEKEEIKKEPLDGEEDDEVTPTYRNRV